MALRGKIFGDMGAYIRTNGGVVPAKAAQFLHGPYRIPAIEVEVAAFMTSKTPVGTYRAPGRFEANFFRERLIDMAARDLGIDPVAFRRKNLITEAEMPYSIGQLVPYETETAYDTGDYQAAFDRCLKEIGWEEKKPLQGRRIEGRYHGVAAVPFVESGGAGPRENARMTLEADGTITVGVGSSALGQGLETVFAQIAGDALSLPFDRFRILHGSTTLVEEGFGTYHSRAVVMGGSAILETAKKLQRAIRAAAAIQFGCAAEDIVVDDGARTASGGRSLEFAPCGKGSRGSRSWSRRHFPIRSAPTAMALMPPMSRSTTVPAMSKSWTMSRSRMSAGRSIRPSCTVRPSGPWFRVSAVFFLDHLIYDAEAQLLNASLADYLLPTSTDFPNVRGVTLELRPSPTNPLGAKGAGEGGIVAVAAAVGNAVANALCVARRRAEGDAADATNVVAADPGSQGAPIEPSA